MQLGSRERVGVKDFHKVRHDLLRKAHVVFQLLRCIPGKSHEQINAALDAGFTTKTTNSIPGRLSTVAFFLISCNVSSLPDSTPKAIIQQPAFFIHCSISRLMQSTRLLLAHSILSPRSTIFWQSSMTHSFFWSKQIASEKKALNPVLINAFFQLSHYVICCPVAILLSGNKWCQTIDAGMGTTTICHNRRLHFTCIRPSIQGVISKVTRRKGYRIEIIDKRTRLVLDDRTLRASPGKSFNLV